MTLFGSTIPRHIRPRWSLLWGCTLALLTLGISLSLLLFTYVRAWEHRGLQNEIDGRAAERAEVLRNKVTASMDVLRAIDSLFAARKNVTRQDFAEFVASALARQPELKALGWTPRVPDGQRAQYEAWARQDGLKDFQFVQLDPKGGAAPARQKDEYFPIYYLEPASGNSVALGFELDSDEVRRETLRRAWQTGQAAATPAMRLIQTTDQDPGFVVYLPLYVGGHVPAPSDRARLLTGFASAVFTVDDLLAPCVSDLPGQGLSVTVTDGDATQSRIYEFPTASASALSPDLAGTASLDVGGQRWTVSLRPTRDFVRSHQTLHANLILGTSLLITLLLCVCMVGGWMQTVRVERRVSDRTAELSREVAVRKRAEETARIAEAKFRSIVENTVEGIFQTSLDGHYLSANKALAKIYSYDSPEELIASLPNIADQLYVQPGRRDDFIRLIQRDGIVFNFESQVRRHDGTVIWISENARAVRGPTSELLYYEGTVIDITARKVAEESLRRARAELESRVAERTEELALSNRALQQEITVRQRAQDDAAAANCAKTDFLARMSHEIRTPMNAILGYAQILQRDAVLSRRQRECIDTMMLSGKHLMELIDDVLDLSKIEAGRAELEEADFNLGQMIQGVLNMFRARCAQRRVELRSEIADGATRMVHGDERKLRQVLVNLIGNAVKFTDEGSVTLRVWREEKNLYRFEVIDTGAGIPHDAMPLVFEPFRQASAGRSRGGTGLGLPIARQHVELMGGQLAVASLPGEGSRFYFALSLGEAARNASPRPQWAAQSLRLAPGHRISALVVDDLEENRTVLAELLRGTGCEVVTADSGEEAVRITQNQRFDVALIDILMPRMDGVATAAALRGKCHRLVAVTASAFAHEQERWLGAGFHDVIVKPVLIQRVYVCLAALLNVEFHPDLPPDSAAPGPSEPAGADQPSIGLPAALRQRMLAAAEVHGITALKQCLEDVQQLAPSQRGLLDRLRRSLHNYNMQEIIDLLNQQNRDAALDSTGGDTEQFASSSA